MKTQVLLLTFPGACRTLVNDPGQPRQLLDAATRMKILFASSEAHPLIKTGGLADVAGSLPQALRALGQDLDRAQRLAQADGLCSRYRAPNDYAWLATHAIRHEDDVLSDSPRQLLALMESAGAFRHDRRWRKLLETYRAASLIDITRAECLEHARIAAAPVSAADISSPGLSGPQLGAAIRERRIEAVKEVLA